MEAFWRAEHGAGLFEAIKSRGRTSGRRKASKKGRRRYDPDTRS